MIPDPTPQVQVLGLTLQDICKAPRHDLHLASQSSQLVVRHSRPAILEPWDDFSPLPVHELPEDCQAVIKMPASQLRIKMDSEYQEKPGLHSMTGKVSLPNGEFVWFKPRVPYRESDFSREIQLLKAIKDANFDDKIRVSQLIGVVTALLKTDQTEVTAVVGLLISWIPPAPEGPHLLAQSSSSLRASQSKWWQQVSRTVETLHGYGICWGDVNLCNIVIDRDSNAWVIDFGGSNNLEFVDDDLAETFAGDWQGIRRIFEEWVPRRINLETDGV